MPVPPRTSLDATSKRIIEELQADGRRSYAAIAASVGLSEAAVRQRVSKLLEAGTIQIVAVSDPLQLGFHRQAMIGICVSGDAREVAAAIGEISAVDYVVITAGRFDLLVEVVCASDAELMELLNTQIRTLPGVRSSEAFMYLELQKQSYDWGTR